MTHPLQDNETANISHSIDPPEWSQQTRLIRGGLQRTGFMETAEALYLTSGYVYGRAEEAEAAFAGETDRFIYSRYGNPTVKVLETRLAALEGAEMCQATASGMSAVFAALACFLKAGDKLVASRALFGSCLHVVNQILPKYGVETILVDGTDLAQWEQALSGGAAAVFLETPSNPALDIIDLEAVCDLAHAAGALVVIDNVFATPLLQKPLQFGADVVVYSATKHIDGQGRCLGGAILCSKDFFDKHLQSFLRHTGPAMSPFNAWVLLKGLETLSLRVNAQSAAAATIAAALAERLGHEKVRYPELASHPQLHLARRQMLGGGTLVSFYLKDDKAAVFRFLNALRLVDISNNLGDTKSLITHPATTTHSKLSAAERLHLGISDGLVRLSVGLEDVEDILDDLTTALKA